LAAKLVKCKLSGSDKDKKENVRMNGTRVMPKRNAKHTEEGLMKVANMDKRVEI